MYIFKCDGWYSYDCGGQLYAEDKCLVTDDVKHLLDKVLDILSKHPQFEFDIYDGDCNSHNWSSAEIQKMWYFEDVDDDELKGVRKALSENSFEYDIVDTVCAVYNEFKSKFNINDRKILKEFFGVSEDDQHTLVEEPSGMTVGKLKKILENYENNTLVVDVEELEEEFL